ncbi:MAG: hypothetical protein ACOYJQ_08310 [Pseudochelatococcus sp.]|jgi:hypothetical protein|uniref:hypothetical protein n=1 Tax=Pseudochelatococcus sp. TaxID=2020869 RepID=UPI003D8EF0C4
MPDVSEEFRSLGALRAAHLDLMRHAADGRGAEAQPDAGSLRAFIARAVATGRHLADDHEREAAQRILDYWSAELAATPDAVADDFRPSLLAPPLPAAGAEASGTRKGRDDGEEEGGRIDSRQAIRLAALARQWRDSGRARGYLLSGSALAKADDYSWLDPDIAMLVKASRQAEHEAVRRSSRTKNIVIAVLGALVLLAGGLAAFAFQAWNAEKAARAAEAEARAAEEAATWNAESDRAELREVIGERRSPQADDDRARLDDAAAFIAGLVRGGVLPLTQVPESLREGLDAFVPHPSPDSRPPSPPGIPRFDIDRLIRQQTADVLARFNVSPVDVGDRLVIGTPAPQQNGADSEGERLAARVPELNGGTPEVRRAAAQALVTALRDDGLPEAEQKKVTAVLAAAAGDASMRALTVTGRLNLLFVLSEIPAVHWERDGWLDLKAQARRAVGDLTDSRAAGETAIGEDTAAYLRRLQANLGISPAPSQTVYPHFVGITREQAINVGRLLRSVGWRVEQEERVRVGPDRSQVRYRQGEEGDRASAELLAADLRAAGQTDAQAAALPQITKGVLEVWLR